MSDDAELQLPEDPWKAFIYLISACATGFGRELIERGSTETEARNTVIGCFLSMAAGEACRIARSEGREPDPAKWRKATDDAFDAAVKRTITPAGPAAEIERRRCRAGRRPVRSGAA